MSRSRRRRRRSQDAPAAAKAARIVQPLSTLPFYALASEERENLIHDKSMMILEEAGIAFYDAEAQRILKAAGVKVVDDIAYFDRHQIAELIGRAPAEFTWTARNPAHSVRLGGDNIVFAPVAGPPYVSDLDHGRRDGTLQDLENFTKLAMMTPYLHTVGSETVVPLDLPFHTRHLDQNYTHFKYGDKPLMGNYTTGVQAYDSVEMAKIVFGPETVAEKHVLHCIINVSSPRRLDDRMLGALMTYARNNQIVNVTPFILSGAMGPVTILGTVAQLNAESLAGIAFAQLVRPGVPCIYGSFQAVVDLQSGAPVFGAPESQLSLWLSAQMARRYQLPFRAAGSYASSKIVDAQAGYEAVMTMLPSLMVRPHFVMHAAGWLENGLLASYEKFVLDCELLGMFQRLAQGVSWDESEWAMDSIVNEVPPGGHHLGTKHTIARFRDAFYRAELFDYDSAEQWQERGALDTATRANRKWKALLAAYEAPALDEGIDGALQEYMTRRKAVIEPSY